MIDKKAFRWMRDSRREHQNTPCTFKFWQRVMIERLQSVISQSPLFKSVAGQAMASFSIDKAHLRGVPFGLQAVKMADIAMPSNYVVEFMARLEVEILKAFNVV